MALFRKKKADGAEPAGDMMDQFVSVATQILAFHPRPGETASTGRGHPPLLAEGDHDSSARSLCAGRIR